MRTRLPKAVPRPRGLFVKHARFNLPPTPLISPRKNIGTTTPDRNFAPTGPNQFPETGPTSRERCASPTIVHGLCMAPAPVPSDDYGMDGVVIGGIPPPSPPPSRAAHPRRFRQPPLQTSADRGKINGFDAFGLAGRLVGADIPLPRYSTHFFVHPPPQPPWCFSRQVAYLEHASNGENFAGFVASSATVFVESRAAEEKGL